MKRSAILLSLAVLALGLLGVSSAANRPLAGDLDPSFGNGGVVTYNTGTKEEYAYVGGIALQPNGKIVVAGGAVPGNHGLILARYKPDGSLDPGFGKKGMVETPIKYWAFADSVALQPDGKIVIAGRSYDGTDANVLSTFILARYNLDGSLDSTFGYGGITTTAFPDGAGNSDAGAYAIAILPDRKILVGGTAHWSNGADFDWSSFALARYNADGSLDTSFGSDGLVTTFFFGCDGLGGIAVKPSGKIVAAGTGGGCGHREIETIALARYHADGSLDPTFGTEGKVTTSRDEYYTAGDVALQTNGKIVISGQALGGKSWPMVARYDRKGRLDQTFGNGGIRLIKQTEGSATAVVLQRDGRIVVAAVVPRSGHRGGTDVMLGRLKPSGARDPSFGKRGFTVTPIQPGEYLDDLYRLVLQPDGNILAGGQSHGGASSSWAVVRFLGGNNCAVPNVRGKKFAKAKRAIRRAYCAPGHIAKQFSSRVGRGRVISQSPKRGTRLYGGSKVSLVVSNGKRG